jgi:hypothetical protein
VNCTRESSPRFVLTKGHYKDQTAKRKLLKVVSFIERQGVMVDGCVVAVFLAAGLLQWVEYDGAPQADKNECPDGPCINFWDAFYFVVVTVCVEFHIPTFSVLVLVTVQEKFLFSVKKPRFM